VRPGKPLKRRARLQAKTGLTQGSTLQRSGRLRPRSKKTEARYVTRRQVVAGVLAAFPWCQIRWDRDCEGRSVDVHEPRKRSHGADICDPAECVATCRHCHNQVHGHPAEAEARGWLIRSGKRRAA